MVAYTDLKTMPKVASVFIILLIFCLGHLIGLIDAKKNSVECNKDVIKNE